MDSGNQAGQDAIRRRAYEIWEREGRPEGMDWEHWFAAQTEMSDESPDLPGSPGGSADGTEAASGSKPFAGGSLRSGRH